MPSVVTCSLDDCLSIEPIKPVKTQFKQLHISSYPHSDSQILSYQHEHKHDNNMEDQLPTQSLPDLDQANRTTADILVISNESPQQTQYQLLALPSFNDIIQTTSNLTTSPINEHSDDQSEESGQHQHDHDVAVNTLSRSITSIDSKPRDVHRMSMASSLRRVSLISEPADGDNDGSPTQPPPLYSQSSIASITYSQPSRFRRTIKPLVSSLTPLHHVLDSSSLYRWIITFAILYVYFADDFRLAYASHSYDTVFLAFLIIVWILLACDLAIRALCTVGFAGTLVCYMQIVGVLGVMALLPPLWSSLGVSELDAGSAQGRAVMLTLTLPLMTRFVGIWSMDNWIKTLYSAYENFGRSQGDIEDEKEEREEGRKIRTQLGQHTCCTVVLGAIAMNILAAYLQREPQHDAYHVSGETLSNSMRSTSTSAIRPFVDEFIAFWGNSLLTLVVNQIVHVNDESALENARQSQLVHFISDPVSAVYLDTTLTSNAAIALGRTAFILGAIMITFTFAAFGAHTVIVPLERTVQAVNGLIADPLADLARLNGQHRKATRRKGPQNETQLVSSTLLKLARLMQVGFGDAGAEIIAKNLHGNLSFLDPMIPGRKIYGIFGFCSLADFELCTEVLEEQVMVFVNQIAEIIHAICHQHNGQVNRSLGGSFLLVWKLRPDHQTAPTQAAAEVKPSHTRQSTATIVPPFLRTRRDSASQSGEPMTASMPLSPSGRSSFKQPSWGSLSLFDRPRTAEPALRSRMGKIDELDEHDKERERERRRGQKIGQKPGSQQFNAQTPSVFAAPAIVEPSEMHGRGARDRLHMRSVSFDPHSFFAPSSDGDFTPSPLAADSDDEHVRDERTEIDRGKLVRPTITHPSNMSPSHVDISTSQFDVPLPSPVRSRIPPSQRRHSLHAPSSLPTTPTRKDAHRPADGLAISVNGRSVNSARTAQDPAQRDHLAVDNTKKSLDNPARSSLTGSLKRGDVVNEEKLPSSHARSALLGLQPIITTFTTTRKLPIGIEPNSAALPSSSIPVAVKIAKSNPSNGHARDPSISVFTPLTPTAAVLTSPHQRSISQPPQRINTLTTPHTPSQLASRRTTANPVHRASTLSLSKLSDQALIAFLHTTMAILTSPTLAKWRKYAPLIARKPSFTVSVSFGLHVGWAIEGAIGSVCKIDASYLSPHVNSSSRLMMACRQYHVQILMSEQFYLLLHPAIRTRCRHIDRVLLKGVAEPINVYTFDICVKDKDMKSKVIRTFIDGDNADAAKNNQNEHGWFSSAAQTGGYIKQALTSLFSAFWSRKSNSVHPHPNSHSHTHVEPSVTSTRDSSSTSAAAGTDGVVNPRLFATLSALQSGLPTNWIPTYNRAVASYLEGDWGSAKDALYSCMSMMPDDESAMSLFRFMEAETRDYATFVQRKSVVEHAHLSGNRADQKPATPNRSAQIKERAPASWKGFRTLKNK